MNSDLLTSQNRLCSVKCLKGLTWKEIFLKTSLLRNHTANKNSSLFPNTWLLGMPEPGPECRQGKGGMGKGQAYSCCSCQELSACFTWWAERAFWLLLTGITFFRWSFLGGTDEHQEYKYGVNLKSDLLEFTHPILRGMNRVNRALALSGCHPAWTTVTSCTTGFCLVTIQI